MKIRNNESIKINKGCSNEIRSDALKIQVFIKTVTNHHCVTDRSSQLSEDLSKKILTQAAIYEKEDNQKRRKKNILTVLKINHYKKNRGKIQF